MLHPRHRSLLRLMLIPVAVALGLGWYGYHTHAEWGNVLLASGIFGGSLVVLLLAREEW